MSNTGISPAAPKGGMESPTDKPHVMSTRRRIPTNWISSRTLQPSIESVVDNFRRHRISWWKAKLVGRRLSTPFLLQTSSSCHEEEVRCCHVIGPTLLKTTFVRIVSSSIPSMLLMVLREPPQAVWYHLALSWCTMVSEVKRRGVKEKKISIAPNNINNNNGYF